MKKILALMLTVMMLMTSISLTAAAAEPTEWYVGLNTATLKFAENVTADNAPEVIITTSAGATVEATATYKANIMTLTFVQKLALDTDYNININGESHTFEVNKVWEPTFTGNATDGYDVSGVILRPGGNNTVFYDVTANNEIVVGNSNGNRPVVIIPDIDTKNELYKNASLSFDVKCTDDSGYAASHTGFNVQNKEDKSLIADNDSSNTAFLWITHNDISTPRRAYKIGDKYSGLTKATSNSNKTNLLADIEYTLSSKTGADYAVTIAETETAKDIFRATATFGSKVNEIVPYSYTVDKMGTTATLTINNTLVDTYIPQDYYTSLSVAGTAPETGYFILGSTRGEKIFSNIMITQMTVQEEEQEIILTASAEVKGEEVEITLAGADNIDISNVAVEDFISFSDSLTYNVVSKEGNTIVIEAINPVYDKQYTLTVREGLGYDNLKVKETQTFNVTFTKEQEEESFEPVSIYAGARTITVECNTDAATEITDEIILTTEDGVAVPFTTKYNEEFLTIIADKEFTRDTQNYIIQIGNYKKLFKIKTLFTPEFVADTTNNTVEDLIIAAGQGATVDVVDSSTILLSTINGSFTLDYEDITKYENASIVADVHFAGGNANRVRGTFAYNVSSKNPTYAYAYNGAVKVNRAFWYLNKEENAIHNRRVAVTDGTSLLHFAGYDTPILPKTVYTDTIKRGFYTNAPGTAFSENQIAIGNTYDPAKDTSATYTPDNKYRYVIDKMGAVGTLMMNDTFIDIMDSQDYYDEYNAANGTALNAATKGYFSINPVSDGNGNSRIILSNIALITSEMKDYEGIEITNVTYKDASGETLESIKNVTAIKGEVTVANRFAAEKDVKLVAIAYSGNKMIGIDILDIDKLPANQPSTREYSFTGLSELTEIKVVAWENFAKMYPYCAPVINNK